MDEKRSVALWCDLLCKIVGDVKDNHFKKPAILMGIKNIFTSVHLPISSVEANFNLLLGHNAQVDPIERGKTAFDVCS